MPNRCGAHHAPSKPCTTDVCNRAAKEDAMRLSDEEEEDEDPVMRGKRLWKQWQQSRMQYNDDDAGNGDEEGCSAAESLLQALSKNKRLKRFKPSATSYSIEESLGEGSMRSSSAGGVDAASAAAAAAADTSSVAPVVSAHIQQLSRTRCFFCLFVMLRCRKINSHFPDSHVSNDHCFAQLCLLVQGVVCRGNVRERHAPHVSRHTSRFTLLTLPSAHHPPPSARAKPCTSRATLPPPAPATTATPLPCTLPRTTGREE